MYGSVGRHGIFFEPWVEKEAVFAQAKCNVLAKLETCSEHQLEMVFESSADPLKIFALGERSGLAQTVLFFLFTQKVVGYTHVKHFFVRSCIGQEWCQASIVILICLVVVICSEHVFFLTRDCVERPDCLK